MRTSSSNPQCGSAGLPPSLKLWRTTVALAKVVRPARIADLTYFFAGARRRSSSNQFVTVANVDPLPVVLVSSTRKCCPSGVTSQVVPRIILNMAVGTPADSVGVVWIGADNRDALPTAVQ